VGQRRVTAGKECHTAHAAHLAPLCSSSKAAPMFLPPHLTRPWPDEPGRWTGGQHGGIVRGLWVMAKLNQGFKTAANLTGV
jgi:hypothetical protein